MKTEFTFTENQRRVFESLPKFSRVYIRAGSREEMSFLVLGDVNDDHYLSGALREIANLIDAETIEFDPSQL